MSEGATRHEALHGVLCKPTKAEWQKLRDKAVEELGVKEHGISKYGDSGEFTYTRWIHIDWRP